MLLSKGFVWTCAACVLLAGCFPNTTDIYRPEASGGILRETMCGFRSGPGIWDEVEFSQFGIRVQVSVGKRKDDFIVNEKLIIPEGLSATISSGTATIYLASSSAKINLQVRDHVWVNGEPRTLPLPNSVLVGKTFHDGRKDRYTGQDQNLSYYFTFITKEAIGEEFYVELPEIVVNGNAMTLPRIHFHHEKITLLSPINC